MRDSREAHRSISVRPSAPCRLEEPLPLTAPTSDVSLSRGRHRRRIPCPSEARERFALASQPFPEPAPPGFPLRDSVRSSKTKTRDAYRRASPIEPSLFRALPRPESFSPFGRSVETLRIPFRFGPSRRARQRVPSSFTSAETVFFSFSRTGRRSRYVLPTNATHNLIDCTRARCFVRSFEAHLRTLARRPKNFGTGEIDAFHDAFDRFGGNAAVHAAEHVGLRDLRALRLSRFVACFRHGLRLFERLTMHSETGLDPFERVPVKEARPSVIRNESFDAVLGLPSLRLRCRPCGPVREGTERRFARRSFESAASLRKAVHRECHAELSSCPRALRFALRRSHRSHASFSRSRSGFPVFERERSHVVVIEFCNTALTHGHVPELPYRSRRWLLSQCLSTRGRSRCPCPSAHARRDTPCPLRHLLRSPSRGLHAAFLIELSPGKR